MRDTDRAGLPGRALIVVALLAVAACSGNGDSTPTSPQATATFTIPTPQASATGTPTPPAPETAYRFVYREFGQEQDTIWSVAPSDASQRQQLAAIPHRPGWGIIPSLSPDGKLLAYTLFPPRAFDERSQSEAYLLELKSGKTELIAKGIDLHLRPVWSPDGKLLFLRRSLENEVMVLQVELVLPGEPEPRPTPEVGPELEVTPGPATRRITTILKADVSDILTFVPVGFQDDKRSMYFVQVEGPGSGGGTVLATYAPATAEAIATATAVATATAGEPQPPATPQAAFVVRLSDQTASEYSLSPDSKKLAFLTQELVEGQFAFRAFVANLVTRSVAPLPPEGLPSGDHLRPLWHPDGSRVSLGLLPPQGEPGAVALVSLDGSPPSFLPAPSVGFDVPLSWAPDGTYLAVTWVKGDSLFSPDRSLVLVAPTGQRITIADGVDVLALAWSKPR